MATTFDNKKRHNLAKHGIDFEDCKNFLDGPVLTEEDTSDAYGEQRLVTLALVQGRLLKIVWTPRGDDERLISAEKATNYETRKFFEKAIY